MHVVVLGDSDWELRTWEYDGNMGKCWAYSSGAESLPIKLVIDSRFDNI